MAVKCFVSFARGMMAQLHVEVSRVRLQNANITITSAIFMIFFERECVHNYKHKINGEF